MPKLNLILNSLATKEAEQKSKSLRSFSGLRALESEVGPYLRVLE